MSHHDHHDHAAAGHDLPHEGPIKTPKQLVAAVVASFVIPIVEGAGTQVLDAQAVAARIAPVGTVDVRDASNPATLKTGEQVYQAQCAACHNAGAAGAPKLGDAGAWGKRLKDGYDHLLTSALKGKGAMGAQGGGDYSDFEIARAVVYMANQAGGKFPEPKAPEAPAKP
jgi:cytochrome c5